MRKLKLQVQTTLDGFIAGENGAMDWIHFAWSEDLIAYVQELTNSMDTILLGRKLAEGFIPHWQGVAQDKENPEQAAGLIFSNTPKIVFSKTLNESLWENTKLAKGDLVEEVQALKKEEGKDIIAYGGASFVSQLIKHKLIDEINLFINPSAIGKGMSIFKEIEGVQRFEVVAVRPFECGIVVLTYKPL